MYYLGWNRSPAQAGCMRQALGPGALGRPRGIGWRGRWEGGSGWGTHVNPWLIHVNVWQKPLQYYKVISLQLTKINEKKEKKWISIQNKVLFCTLHSDFFFKLMEIPVFIFFFMLHFYTIIFSLNSLKWGRFLEVLNHHYFFLFLQQ